MVYAFLISIVFIAEIIIAVTIFQSLNNIDKKIANFDESINSSKDGIKDIAILCRRISGQFVIFAEDFVYSYRKKQEDLLTKQLSKIFIAILLLKINSKAINNIKKSKAGKLLSKGLSLLENMV